MPASRRTPPPADDEADWITELRKRTHELGNLVAKQQNEIRHLKIEVAKKGAEIARIVSHTMIVLALLAAYVAVTLHGDDGTLVLGLLAGYVGGAAVEKAANGRAPT